MRQKSLWALFERPDPIERALFAAVAMSPSVLSSRLESAPSGIPSGYETYLPIDLHNPNTIANIIFDREQTP